MNLFIVQMHLEACAPGFDRRVSKTNHPGQRPWPRKKD